MSGHSPSPGSSVIALITFCTALPYPAIALGANTGLQLGHAIALGFWLLLPFFPVRRDLAAAVVALAVLMLPAVAMDGAVNTYAMSVLALGVIPLGAYAWSRSPAGVIRGFALALVFHAIVASVQVASYVQGVFPYPELYRNPSFWSIDELTQTAYAVWNKRAFGYMPEPSSTIAALGAPWLLVTYAMLGRVDAWFESGVDRLLAGLAVIGGLFLFAVGQSGAVLLLMALVLPLATVAPRRVGDLGWPLKLAVAAFAVGMFALLFGDEFAARIFSERESAGSWDERLSTIRFALGAVADMSASELLFGYGAVAISDRTVAHTGATGIHSWIVAFVVAHGLSGVLGLAGLVAVALRPGRAPLSLGFRRARTIAALFLGFALCIVTGYGQLLSMWLCAGLLIDFGATRPEEATDTDNAHAVPRLMQAYDHAPASRHRG